MCQVGACHIWVFQASDAGVGAYNCPESTLGTDLCSGGSLDLDGCDVCLATLSAGVCTSSTSFSVTYLWASQVTIVTVDEGTVYVTAVHSIEGAVPSSKQLGPQRSVWQDLEVKRALDEVATAVGAEGGPRVYWTAPDRIRDMILKANPDAPPAREPLPIESLPFFYDRLPVVLREIGLEEPNLPQWIYEISQRAILREAPFPFLPPPSLGLDELLVRAERDLLANRLVYQALLDSAARGGLTYLPGLEIGELTPGTVVDGRVFILFAADDDRLAAVADALYGQLAQQGFTVELAAVPERELLRLEPGAAVISLGRR